MRVYFAGFGCSGPSFALALDKEVEGADVYCDLEGIHFIMDQDEFLTYGNVIIQEVPNKETCSFHEKICLLVEAAVVLVVQGD